MMKKTTKAALLAAALAFTAGLAGCFVSAVEDDGAGSGSTAQDGGSGGAATYELVVTNIPETTGTITKVDDTVTVISSGSGKTIKCSNKTYIQMSGNAASADYGLQLTLPNPATITVTATKKSGGSATAIVLLDSAGKKTGITTGAIDEYNASATAASLTPMTLEVPTAGTYILGADANGCLLYSLKISYKN